MIYITNAIERIIKYLIDSTKLTIKTMKVIFFLSYLGVFTYKYFIKITGTKGAFAISFDPGKNENSASSLFGIAVLLIFLILIDILDNHLKSNRLGALIKDDKIPLSMKEKFADELLRIK